MSISVDLDKVTFNIKRASWASFPELTLEINEWQRLRDEGKTQIIIQSPNVFYQKWSAYQYMINAAQELKELPELMAGIFLNLAASDQ